jgi:hypothetical protein
MRISSSLAISISLLLALLFAAGGPMLAQHSGQPKNSVTINTDLVVTWAHVFDGKDGTVIRGTMFAGRCSRYRMMRRMQVIRKLNGSRVADSVRHL